MKNSLKIFIVCLFFLGIAGTGYSQCGCYTSMQANTWETDTHVNVELTMDTYPKVTSLLIYSGGSYEQCFDTDECDRVFSFPKKESTYYPEIKCHIEDSWGNKCADGCIVVVGPKKT